MLSLDDIERMVSDAEKFKAEDDKQKKRIAAKNNLESYCFNMKSTIEDEKLKDKIGEAERKTIMDKCNEVIAWLDANQTAEEDEYKDKQKEVIISKHFFINLYIRHLFSRIFWFSNTLTNRQRISSLKLL